MSFWVYLGRVTMTMLWWTALLLSSIWLINDYMIGYGAVWLSLIPIILMMVSARRMTAWWNRIYRKPKLVAAIDTLVKEYEKELGESDITWLSPHEVNGELYFVEIYKKQFYRARRKGERL